MGKVSSGQVVDTFHMAQIPWPWFWAEEPAKEFVKAACKDFILSGFVLWPVPRFSPTAHVPHCSGPQCCFWQPPDKPNVGERALAPGPG